MKPINQKIRIILKESYKESDRLGCNEITPDHILMVILNDPENETNEILSLMGFDCEELTSKIEAYLRLKIKSPIIKKKLLSLSKSSKRMLSVSEMELDKLGDKVLYETHLILAILKDKELDCTKVLKNQGIDYKTFRNTLLEIKKK